VFKPKKEREKALKKRDKAAKKIVGVSEAVPSGSKKLALSRELGIDTKSNANEQKEVPGTPIDAPDDLEEKKDFNHLSGH